MARHGSERPEYDDEQQKYRITVRFGVELLEDGHTAVPNLVLNHYAKLGISPAEMMFTIHIWQYWWTEKQPYPSLQAVADKMQVSRRQVRNYAQSLKEKQLLEVHERYAPGLGQTTSEYDFSRFFRRIVEAAKGGETPWKDSSAPPRKDSSEGGRKGISEAPRNYSSPEEYEGEEYSLEEDEVINSKEIDTDVFISNRSNAELSTILRVQSTVDNGRTGDLANPHPLPLPANKRASSIGSIPNRALPQAPAPAGSGYAPGRGRPPKAPDQLTVAMEEVSQKLNDEQPRSSLTRATKLWRESGLPVDKFCQRVYQAMAETREAKATKRSAYGDGVLNRTPLFFAELERQLGFRDEKDWSVRHVPPGL